MRAIVQRDYGSPDVLRVAEIDRPRAGAGEVLLRVHAAGLDPGVWHLMTGRPYPGTPHGIRLRKPKHKTPGQDAAGTVAAVGAGVTRFQPGDEVFGACRGRLRRVRLRARNGARSEAGKPHLRAGGHRSDVGAHRSSGAPRRGSGTAWPAGVDHRRGRRGGDVRGTARPGVGADVTGVCSASKMDLVRAIGAQKAIDYAREDFADGRRRYNVIIDTAGNRSLGHLRRALLPAGTLVIIGGRRGRTLARRHGSHTPGAPPLAARAAPAPLADGNHAFRGLAVPEDLIEAGKVAPVPRPGPIR